MAQDDRQITITIAAKNLTEEEFAKARAALSGVSAGAKGTASEVTSMASSFKHAEQGAQGFVGSLTNLGHSFAARVAEGFLLRDAIRKVLDVMSEIPADLEDIGKRGAAVSDLARNFQYLSSQAGVSAKDMLAQLREGTAGALDDFTLMKLANKAMGDQLDASGDNMKVLAAGARELGKAVGQNTADAFDVLTTAVSTGRTMTLAQYGIFVDTKKAVDDYARSVGKTTGELTTFEHQTALAHAAMQALRDRLALAGPQAADLGEQIDGLKARVRNFFDQIDLGISESPVLKAGLEGIGDAVGAAFGGDQQTLISGVVHAVNEVAIGITGLAQVMLPFANVATSIFDGVAAVAHSAMAIVLEGVSDLAAGVRDAAQLASYLPGVGDKFTGLAQQAELLRQNMHGLAAGQAESTAESLKGVVGYGAVHDAIGRMESGLVKMQASMIAADAIEHEAGDANDKLAGSHHALAGGISQTAAQAAAYAKALKDYNSVGQGLYDTLGRMNSAVVEGIKNDLDRGESQATLQKIYHVTAEQVKAVADAMAIERSIEKTATEESTKEFAAWQADVSKAADVVAKSIIDGAIEIQKAQIENADETAKLTQTSLDYQITKIKEAEAAKILAFKGTADQKKVFIQQENEIADKQVAALKIDSNAISNNSVTSLQQTADVARATYDYMLEHHTEFTAAVIEHYREIAKAAQDAADGNQRIWENTFKSTAGQIPQLIQQGLTGGGGLAGSMNAVGSMAGSEFGKGIVKNLTKDVPQFMTSTLGTLIGSAIPVVGSLAGPLLKKLFSIGAPSQQELQGRDTEKKFQDSFGSFNDMMAAVGRGYAQAGESAQQAQADVQSLMSAEKQGTAATQAAVDKISKVMADGAAKVSSGVQDILTAAQAVGGQAPDALKPLVQQLADMPGLTDAEKQSLLGLTGAVAPNFAQLTQTAANYGLTLQDLGPKFEQADISKRADQIVSDFQNLTKAGADTGNVIKGMGSSVSTLVDDALKYGSTLPTALQPIVDQLAKAGELTDSSGRKITDLSKLKFDDAGDPLAQGMKNLTDAINNLDKLLGGLPDTAQTAADGIGKALSKVHPTIDVNFAGHVSASAAAPTSFASEAYVRRPTLAIVGDAPGGELVVKPSTVSGWMAQAAAAGAASAAPTFNTRALEDKLDQQTARLASLQTVFRNLPSSLARAVRDGQLAAR